MGDVPGMRSFDEVRAEVVGGAQDRPTAYQEKLSAELVVRYGVDADDESEAIGPWELYTGL